MVGKDLNVRLLSQKYCSKSKESGLFSGDDVAYQDIREGVSLGAGAGVPPVHRERRAVHRDVLPVKRSVRAR